MNTQKYKQSGVCADREKNMRTLKILVKKVYRTDRSALLDGVRGQHRITGLRAQVVMQVGGVLLRLAGQVGGVDHWVVSGLASPLPGTWIVAEKKCSQRNTEQ